jgi:hypothetical protein
MINTTRHTRTCIHKYTHTYIHTYIHTLAKQFATNDNGSSPSVLDSVPFGDQGGYEVKQVLIDDIKLTMAKLNGEDRKVIGIDVKFVCNCFVDVVLSGGLVISVKPRDEPKSVENVVAFISPLPWDIPGAPDPNGGTDFDWRIHSADEKIL